MMSIQTPVGVFSSRRLLQGGTDAGSHFQAVLQETFDGRVEKLLQWIDDFLFYAASEKELLDNIDSFLQVCSEIGLKIHAEEITLFATTVQFCGHEISKNGIQYHPRNFESIISMRNPTLASELQQFICANNWMRNSIPAYTQRIAPLHDLLESCYKKAGKRTKQALRKLSIITSWGAIHDAAFADIKEQLTASVKLAFPKHDHKLCLFTDASDTHWASVLTQVPEEDLFKALDEQRHEPLCFLSGAFSGSSANWSVAEKEGYAIVESICRLDFSVFGREVTIFTDHANLVYLYDPYGNNTGMAKHTASKLMRWAIKLSAFRYVIEHLPGELNVWADMLTRWAVSPKRKVDATKVLHDKSLMLAPINPGTDPKLDWPNINDIIKAQKSSKEKPPKQFTRTTGGVKDSSDILWIPSEERHLKLRIIIAAYTGHGGHRSWRVTMAVVKAHFFWNKMSVDVESFVSSCLHCLCTETGSIVPRPLGHGLHSVEPNKLLHFDFCYMSNGEEGNAYVLILKDDHSRYVWL